MLSFGAVTVLTELTTVSTRNALAAGTALEERDRDLQRQALVARRGAKVALAEIPLFGPKTAANLCTLYQKDCVAGEKIRVGKWAVAVFFP